MEKGKLQSILDKLKVCFDEIEKSGASLALVITSSIGAVCVGISVANCANIMLWYVYYFLTTKYK